MGGKWAPEAGHPYGAEYESECRDGWRCVRAGLWTWGRHGPRRTWLGSAGCLTLVRALPPQLKAAASR